MHMRLFSTLLLVAAFCVAWTACGPVASTSTLTVGMDLSYPPFETIDESGEPSGISVEIAEALGDYLARPVRIENIPFVGLIPALQTNKVDLVISSMTETSERAESIDFSDPYLSTGLALLVGTESPITSADDLDQPERTIAVRQGTTGETYARSAFTQAKVLALEKESSAVLEVIQGKADAFIYDQMSVWQNARQHPGETKALLQPIKEESWVIGIKKGNDSLRDQVNAFLRIFRSAEGFEQLGDKYLGDQKEAFERENIPFYF